MPSTPPPPPPPSARRYDANTVVTADPRTGAGVDRSGVVARPSDFEHFVRLDARGNVLSGHGQVEQLGSIAAYACSVADVVGQLLQFGPCIAVEARFAGGSVFAVREERGQIVGLKPHVNTNLYRLRTQLKL
jgi:hypothetical protein